MKQALNAQVYVVKKQKSTLMRVLFLAIIFSHQDPE
jgi:hypothetical protein